MSEQEATVSAAELAERLVGAFGKPTEIIALLQPDAEWHLHVGSQAPSGSYTGHDAIEVVMRRVFGEIYEPSSVRVTIHDAFGAADRAVVRFRLQARTVWCTQYTNEYVLIARTSGDRIAEVWEYMDGIAANEQLAGSAASD